MKVNEISKIKIVLLAVVLLLTAFTLVACSEDDDNKFDHTITHVSTDYESAGKYVFEQGQTATVSFFVEFDPDMPDAVADASLGIDFREGDTIISKFDVSHTVAEMDTGITIEIPIPTDTLGTTDYHIILLSKYGIGCGTSTHKTQIDFAVEVIPPAANNSGSGSDNSGSDNSGSDNSDSDNSGSDNSDSDDSGSDNSGSDNSDAGATGTGTGISFAITQQPVNTSVAVGSPLTLSVAASGSGTLSYQWFTSLANSTVDGVKLAGQTSASLALATNSAFSQFYYCVITQSGTGATLISNIVTASAFGGEPTPTPTPEPAPTSYGIWVTGTEVTSENADDIIGDNLASYDAATNTLFIKGFIEISSDQVLTGDPYKDAIIGSSKDLRIEATDGNDTNKVIYIESNNSTANTGLTRGIYVTGDLSIHLFDTLIIALETNGSDGIHVTGDLSVTKDNIGVLTVSAGDGNENYIHGGKGVYCGGDISVNGGLTAQGGQGHFGGASPFASGGIGIDARGSITVENDWSEVNGHGGAGGGVGENRGAGGIGVKTPEIEGSVEGFGGLGVPDGADIELS